MVYMLMVAERTTTRTRRDYALCTGFMALGMMLPGMAAGWLQERLGMSTSSSGLVATLPSFAAAALVRIGGVGRRR